MYNRAFLLLILSTILCLRVWAQAPRQVLIDSLNKELSNSKDDTNKANILDKISFLYSKTDPAKGIKVGEQLFELSKKLKWRAGMAKANAVLGINYASLSDHGKAISYYGEALKISKELKDKPKIAGNTANICLIYLSQGNYSKALSTGFDALRIYEELNDVRNAAVIQENIGVIYYERKEYTKAMEYYTMALEGYKSVEDKESIARCYGNIGTVLGATGELDKALANHLMALETNRLTGNRYSTQINLANIGIIQSQMGNHGAALDNHFEALKISRDMGDRSSTAVNMGNIGAAYQAAVDSGSNLKGKYLYGSREENLRQAIKYYEQATHLCRELNFSGPLVEFTKGLSDVYFLAGNYKKAHEVYKDHVALKDSLFSLQSKLEIADLEMKRKEELRNKDLLISKNARDISRLKTMQKQSELLVYLAAGLAIILLIVFILKNLFAYRRSNKILSREKELHLTHIKTQTELLEEIAHIQAHEVSGPVATILGLVNAFNSDNPSDPSNQTVINGITEVTKVLDEKVKEVIRKKNSLTKL